MTNNDVFLYVVESIIRKERALLMKPWEIVEMFICSRMAGTIDLILGGTGSAGSVD